jgi:hypothetical protein
MAPDTPNTDLVGKVTADITDHITMTQLENLAEDFEVDTKRYDVKGLNIYGTENLFVSFICVDKEKSSEEKEHIVEIRVDDDAGIEFGDLFKHLSIELTYKYTRQYEGCTIDETIDLDEE